MITKNERFPVFADVGEAPHLFQNLIGTFVPYQKFKRKSDADKSMREGWYYVETTSLVRFHDERLYRYPQVILGNFHNWMIIPPDEFETFSKSKEL